jgi:hypothetical protein
MPSTCAGAFPRGDLLTRSVEQLDCRFRHELALMARACQVNLRGLA